MPIKVGLQYIDLWQESLEEQVRICEEEICEKGQIVFYGPSYFRRWSRLYDMTPMAEMIKAPSGKQCVINRGFGSSCAEHQLYYYPRMIRPLAPKVLVYNSHANGACFGYSDEESWELAQRVVAYAKTDFPGIHIYLVGAHPTRDMTEADLVRKREYNETLPWDHIDFGVSKSFLINENKLAHMAVTTKNCRQECAGCGAACFGEGVCYEKR